MDLEPTLDPMDDPSFTYARKFAERSYTSFMTSLNGLPIGKYFNVDCLDITITQTNTLNYILRIEYKNTYPDLIKVKLPYDVIKHIKSYVERRVILNINIFYVKDTPFKPPTWTPMNIFTFNLKHRDFQHIIKKHYYENKHDWSPTIVLEKDILYFIERIMFIL
jgi:hypothetical protein